MRDRVRPGGRPGKKITGVEALLFDLCLRLGFPHPDYLLPYLDAGQLDDWSRFDAQRVLAFDRDDRLWAESRADYINAHLPAGETPVRWQEVAPYFRDDEALIEAMLGQELTAAELLAKIGFGVRKEKLCL